jgi:hypothetical protein
MNESIVKEKLIDGRKIVQSWFHSRKALLLLVTFAIATVALFVGKLDGDHWVQVCKWAIPSYMAGNVGDSIATALGGGNNA